MTNLKRQLRTCCVSVEVVVGKAWASPDRQLLAVWPQPGCQKKFASDKQQTKLAEALAGANGGAD